MVRIPRTWIYGLAAFATVAASGIPAAAIGHRCRHGCPQCDHKTCVPRAVESKVARHCWQVDCKDICIPAIRWPWQTCCEPPRCGQVKTVKVLKKVEYECPRCGYEWDVKCSVCSQ